MGYRETDDGFPPMITEDGKDLGPQVVRDCMDVKEIASNPHAFLGHARPHYYQQRDERWNQGKGTTDREG